MTIVQIRQFHVQYLSIMPTLTYILVNNVIIKNAMNLKIMHNILNLDTEVVKEVKETRFIKASIISDRLYG